VGRQRYLAVLGEGGRRVERAQKPYASQAAAQHLDDLDRTVVAEPHRAARFELSSRMSHREPGAVGKLPDEEEFRLAAGATHAASCIPHHALSVRNYVRHVLDEAIS